VDYCVGSYVPFSVDVLKLTGDNVIQNPSILNLF